MSAHKLGYLVLCDAHTKAAGVPQLLITHVPPTGDPEAHRAEAEASFGAPVGVARPHERYSPT